ncbi:MAG: PAS domain S-box protein [Bacteroidetes bacterium]|nr:PAS domain S-box protein [Bacteroidota bacterium]MCH8523144.1 PAS domain S-box protein [Balneolales bacterium]
MNYFESQLRAKTKELEKTKDELQDKKRKLTGLLSSKTTYVIRTDLQGNYTYVNESFIDTFSHVHGHAEELIGHNSMLSIYGPDRGKVEQLIFELLNKPSRTIQIELRKPLSNGEFRYTMWDFSCLMDAAGNPFEIQCIGVDITRKKENELHLRNLSHAVEQSPATVMITDIHGNIEYVNAKFTEATGYTESEVLGKNPRLLNSGKQTKAFYTDLWGTITSGHSWKGEFHNRRKDGKLFWESASISPLKDEDGNITNYIAVKEDITDKVKSLTKIEALLSEKERQNKRLTNFTHIVSHNLRSHSANMEAIFTLLELDHKEIVNNPYIEMMRVSADRLKETIDDLNTVLDISMVDTDAWAFISLKDEAKAAWSSISQLACDAGVKLYNHVPDGFTIRIIPAYLKSILLNLLTNAVKYKSNSPEPYIRLGAYVSEDRYHLIVSDNGIGIDMNMHGDKVFGMYKTFHERPNSKGLGLYMVKHQVEAMGGEISLESLPDKGCTFTISIPR